MSAVLTPPSSPLGRPIIDAAFRADPYPTYAALRAPVFALGAARRVHAIARNPSRSNNARSRAACGFEVVSRRSP